MQKKDQDFRIVHECEISYTIVAFPVLFSFPCLGDVPRKRERQVLFIPSKVCRPNTWKREAGKYSLPPPNLCRCCFGLWAECSQMCSVLFSLLFVQPKEWAGIYLHRTSWGLGNLSHSTLVNKIYIELYLCSFPCLYISKWGYIELPPWWDIMTGLCFLLSNVLEIPPKLPVFRWSAIERIPMHVHNWLFVFAII